MPAAPATVTGNFGNASVQITITTSPANLLVSADGGTPTAAPLVETWVIGSPHTIATSSPQAGGSGVQFVWSKWSDAGAISHSITVPSTATTYTATFDTQYQLTTQASPSADGSVTPASGSFFASGATIPVTATPNATFTFSNWSSTGGTFDSTTAASTNFHMPAAPATVTGNFATTGDFTISASPLSQTISSGHTATYTITLTSVGGLTGNVSLGCTGNPPHSTCTISPNPVTLNGTATTTVKLSPSRQANHGTFTLTFTGSLGSITHSAQVKLTVK
jgi:hypothetical protein